MNLYHSFPATKANNSEKSPAKQQTIEMLESLLVSLKKGDAQIGEGSFVATEHVFAGYYEGIPINRSYQGVLVKLNLIIKP